MPVPPRSPTGHWLCDAPICGVPVRADCIDTIIHGALDSLVSDLSGRPWRGRERELVSLFAFQHLLPVGAISRPALKPGQIGIEVAVPQHRPHGGRHRKANVCKDLVIWPAERMTTWMGSDSTPAYPLAAMEWKTLNDIGVAERVAAKRREAEADAEWLKRATAIAPTMRGYGVLVDLRKRPVALSCRIFGGGRLAGEWTWGRP